MTPQLQNAIAAGMWAALAVGYVLCLIFAEDPETHRRAKRLAVAICPLFVIATAYSTYVWS